MLMHLYKNLVEWSKNRYNQIFLLILIFAFILRIKYLNFHQPLWWDEAEYLSIAKHWAYGIPFEVSSIRPYLFSFFVAILYKIGLGAEWILRIIELITSLFVVFLTYILGKKMFDSKVGLISSFIMSSFYLTLFYTSRIMVDIPSTLLWVVTIYMFWEGYIMKKSKYYVWLMGFFMGLGYVLRFTTGIVGLVILIYLLVTQGLKFLKNKDLWIAFLICFATMIPYFIYFYVAFDKIPVIEGATYGFGHGTSFGIYFSMIPILFQSYIPLLTQVFSWFQAFLILFIIGLGYILFNTILGIDLLRKDENLKKYLMLILWIIVPFIFYGMVPGYGEDRYLLIIFPAIFFVASFMLLKLVEPLGKYNKYLPYLIIGLILFSGAYTQVKYADRLITAKSTSYIQIKEAGLWIKEHSNPGDIIVSTATPTLTYYTEREVKGFQEPFDEFILKDKPKYFFLTALERSPEWTYKWPQEHPDKIKPVHAIFFDPDTQKQPAVIIYEFVYAD